MTLRIEQTARDMNPFDMIDCPNCRKAEFVSIDHSIVECEECGLEFRVRMTAGDQGFVVDAYENLPFEHDETHRNIHRLNRVACRVVKVGEYDSDWMFDDLERRASYEPRKLEPPMERSQAL